MSLNKKRELSQIAKNVCRELRGKSTIAEKIFWETVRNRRFMGRKFLRQHPLFYDITGNESFFIADFYCHSERLVIELDGDYHKYHLKNDKERASILELLGISVLRFKNEEVIENIESVLVKVGKHFI